MPAYPRGNPRDHPTAALAYSCLASQLLPLRTRRTLQVRHPTHRRTRQPSPLCGSFFASFMHERARYYRSVGGEQKHSARTPSGSVSQCYADRLARDSRFSSSVYSCSKAPWPALPGQSNGCICEMTPPLSSRTPIGSWSCMISEGISTEARPYHRVQTHGRGATYQK